MDCSPPGSSVHGILQGRTLEWIAIPFSRGSSQLRDQTRVSYIAGRFFTIWATREAHLLPYIGTFGFPYPYSWPIGKDSDAGRDWGQEEKGTTEDEMAGWHHWLDGRGSEWIPGVGDGRGGLACCNPWGRKESDMTEWLIWSDLIVFCQRKETLALDCNPRFQAKLHVIIDGDLGQTSVSSSVKWGNSSASLTGLLWGLNEIMRKSCLA